MVQGEGIGVGTSLIVVDRQDAQAAAREESAAEAVFQAKVTAALLPCPRCGRRSRSSWC